MGGMNQKRPNAIKGTINHAKTSFSTEILCNNWRGSMFSAATVTAAARC
jgi:hypothetical protein